MQLMLKFSDKKFRFSASFLAIQLAYLFILFALLHQTEVEMQKQLRSNTIISKANSVSKLFYDAGIAIVVYSISKNQVLSDRYKKIALMIPQEISDLRTVVGNNEHEKQVVANISAITNSGLEILNDAKSQAETGHFDLTQANSRQMYSEIRSLAARLSTELSQLTDGEDKIEKKVLAPAEAVSWHST